MRHPSREGLERGLLEDVQVDEQGDRDELALRVGAEDQAGVALACGCALRVGDRSASERLVRSRVGFDVADYAVCGFHALRNDLQRPGKCLERLASFRLCANGRRHGRSLVVQMRLEGDIRPAEIDFALVSGPMVMVMVMLSVDYERRSSHEVLF